MPILLNDNATDRIIAINLDQQARGDSPIGLENCALALRAIDFIETNFDPLTFTLGQYFTEARTNFDQANVISYVLYFNYLRDDLSGSAKLQALNTCSRFSRMAAVLFEYFDDQLPQPYRQRCRDNKTVRRTRQARRHKPPKLGSVW